MSSWQWLESGLGGARCHAQYNLAQICSLLEQFAFLVYYDFRYRVDPFANFRVPKDIRKGS